MAPLKARPAADSSADSAAESVCSLYVHIPFCAAKCHYCDFGSVTGREDLWAPYVDAVLAEASKRAPRIMEYRQLTVHFGGGTPSLLPPALFAKLAEGLQHIFSIPGFSGMEAAIEANPGTLSREKLAIYRACGINRLNLGLQSAMDHHLAFLGRIHRWAEFEENVERAEEAGFRRLGADLIFGFPGLTEDEWDRTLERMVGLRPELEHLSCYSLSVEPGTRMEGMIRDGTTGCGVSASPVEPVSDEMDRRMYGRAIRLLREGGFRQYELSNFARAGGESVHNTGYWILRPYLGLGAAAHSFLPGPSPGTAERQGNIKDPEAYVAAIRRGDDPAAEWSRLTQKDLASETMFLGLRLTRGVDRESFRSRFGRDPDDWFDGAVTGLVSKKLLKTRGRFISLTRRGMDLANICMEKFV